MNPVEIKKAPQTAYLHGLWGLLFLFKLAKFDVILIRFGLFSILYSFENSGFSTHYFSFHTLLVPIQYQLFFVIIVCSSSGLQVV